MHGTWHMKTLIRGSNTGVVMLNKFLRDNMTADRAKKSLPQMRRDIKRENE